MSKRTRLLALFYALACLVCMPLLFPATTYADNFPFIGTLHAGRHPEALAVDSQTHMLYIGYEAPGLAVGFDPIKGMVNWRTPLKDSVTDVQVDSISHHVYAVGSDYGRGGGTLAVLDGATGHVLFTAPVGVGDSGIALDSKRQRVYVSGQESGKVYVFTFLTGWRSGPIRVRASVLHIGSQPGGLGVNTQLGRLYVSDTLEHIVTVVDEDNGHTIATIPVAAQPTHPLRVDERSGRVYVVCSAGQELDVIDGKTNQVIARTPVAPNPEGIAFNTATGRIYVADEGEQTVGTTITVIDGQNFSVIGTLQVGNAPDGVEADAALHRVYISLENSDTVVELSDSIDIPLKAASINGAIAAQHAISFLQQATIITLIVMLLTIAGTALAVLSPRWRGLGSLQTPPADASSR